jgi:RecB family exonuclease
MIPRETKGGQDLVAETWDGLERLVASYDEVRQGYRARAAVEKVRFEGDYDHLARFGEWSDADAFAPQDVGSEDPA